MMNSGRSYKYYLSIACKQILRNILAIITRLFNEKENVQFHTENSL